MLSSPSTDYKYNILYIKKTFNALYNRKAFIQATEANYATVHATVQRVTVATPTGNIFGHEFSFHSDKYLGY